MQTVYPMLMKPVHTHSVWGGETLARLRGEEGPGYGTSWEISAHPHAESLVANGPLAGQALAKVIADRPKEMLGLGGPDRMLRTAFLDALEPLSVQVHPTEDYARERGDHGKTESWYIVAADAGATLVAGVTTLDAERLRAAAEDGTIEEYLVHHSVSSGDFVHIPAGMVHALGGGIVALEVGTNSDTTYRVFDYGRTDGFGSPRELHLDDAFAVADLSLRTEVVHAQRSPSPSAASSTRILVSCPDYTVEVVELVDGISLNTKGGFDCLTVVSGTCKVMGMGDDVVLKTCDSVFVPASTGTYGLRGTGRLIRGYAR
ncbi:MAG: type I phosphomannose isomerase catalytic subunit [Atopobiaceae bacterium]|jgi:mannose-6-phosphate isomerase|nr:class I mannose-6-phosphate isomerase [Atopobiaceae bacterium]